MREQEVPEGQEPVRYWRIRQAIDRYGLAAIPTAAIGIGATAALYPTWAPPISLALAGATLMWNLLHR